MRLGRRRNAFVRLFPKRSKVNKYLLFIFIGLLITYIIYSFYANVRPILSSMAESKAQILATLSINDTIQKIMSENQIDYDDLISIRTNSSDEIIALQSNTIKINELKSKIAVAVQGNVSSIESAELNIPLGAMLNNELFAGVGPRIPIKVMTMGVANVNFTDDFTEAGINQTKHKINLEVKVKISIMFPTIRKSQEVSTIVPVAQTIIVGKVPNSYTSIEGAAMDKGNIITKIIE